MTRNRFIRGVLGIALAPALSKLPITTTTAPAVCPPHTGCDTAYLQRALDTGRTVPARTYRLTSTVVMRRAGAVLSAATLVAEHDGTILVVDAPDCTVTNCAFVGRGQVKVAA